MVLSPPYASAHYVVYYYRSDAQNGESLHSALFVFVLVRLLACGAQTVVVRGIVTRKAAIINFEPVITLFKDIIEPKCINRSYGKCYQVS